MTVVAMGMSVWFVVQRDILLLCVTVTVYALVFMASTFCTFAAVTDETRDIERMIKTQLHEGSGMIYVYVHPCTDRIETWVSQLDMLFDSVKFSYERDPEFVLGRVGYIIYWADANTKLEFETSLRPLPLSSSMTHQPTLGRLVAVMEYVETIMGAVKKTKGENWSDTTSNTSRDITCGGV